MNTHSCFVIALLYIIIPYFPFHISIFISPKAYNNYIQLLGDSDDLPFEARSQEVSECTRGHSHSYPWYVAQIAHFVFRGPNLFIKYAPFSSSLLGVTYGVILIVPWVGYVLESWRELEMGSKWRYCRIN